MLFLKNRNHGCSLQLRQILLTFRHKRYPDATNRRLIRERASLCTSLRGSLTVEASFVLPLFLLAMISFLFFIELIRTERQVQDAMTRTGMAMAQYAYETDLTSIYAHTKILSYLEQDGWNAACVRGGKAGLSCLFSETLNDKEQVDLVVTYHMRLPCNIFRLPDIPMAQRVCCRAWTGYKPEDEDDTAEEVVYVTETGTVYHKSLECTYIRLSIRTVSIAGIPGLRNEDGGKYYLCEQCGGGKIAGGMVYITNAGNRYHTSLTCSGLKRGIMTIPISQAGGYRPCSRCGG